MGTFFTDTTYNRESGRNYSYQSQHNQYYYALSSDLLAWLIGWKPAYVGRWKTCWAEPRRRPRVAYGSGFDLGKPPSRLLAQA